MDGMNVIAVVGALPDAAMSYFARRSETAGVETVMIDVGAIAAQGRWQLEIPAQPSDWVESDAGRVYLGAIPAFYNRLPLRATAVEPARSRHDALRNALTSWLETTSAVVVNRPGGHIHYLVRPLQHAWLNAHGLRAAGDDTPHGPGSGGCIGPESAHDMSGVVGQVSAAAGGWEVAGGTLGSCFRHPRLSLAGLDISVIVVAEWISGWAWSRDIDDDQAGYSPTSVDVAPGLASRLVQLTRAQGLSFAEWRFCVDAREAVWCREVDPRPPLKRLDCAVGGRITTALHRHLLRDGLMRRMRPERPAKIGVPAGASEPTRSRDGVPLWVFHVELAARLQPLPPCGGDTSLFACSGSCESLMHAFGRLIDGYHEVLDSGLRAPGRWQGLLRREMLGRDVRGEGQRYRACYRWIVEEAGYRPLTVALVQEIHDRGVGGSILRSARLAMPTRVCPDPEALPAALEALVARANANDAWPACVAARLQHDILLAHPFSDGNGRTSRLVATASLVNRGYKSSLFLASEEFTDPHLAGYINILNAFDAGVLCRAACLAGLTLGIAAAAGPAAWLRRLCADTRLLGERLPAVGATAACLSPIARATLARVMSTYDGEIAAQAGPPGSE